MSDGPTDPWHLRHYRERINTYYAEAERPFALNLLDAFGAADQPLTFGEVFNLISHAW